MPFEAELPKWEAPGIEPLESKKLEGWLPSEKPPADYWNWQMNRNYLALKELQEKAADNTVGVSAPIPITAGSQVVQGGNAPAIVQPRVEGRTLINLLGDKGACESVAGWTTSAANIDLDTSVKVAGAASIKVEIGGPVGYGRLDIPIAKDTGYYVAIADIRAGSGAQGRLRIVDSIAIRASSDYVTDTAAFVPAVALLNSSTIDADAEWVAARFQVDGEVGSYANFDQLRIYSITVDEYAALDDMTADQIATRYPFVGTGIRGVRNPTLEIVQDNLIPPFNVWDLFDSNFQAHHVLNEPYSITLNAQSNFEKAYIYLMIEPGQEYTISAITNGRIDIKIGHDHNASELARLLATGSVTFTAPEDGKVTARIDNGSLGAGEYLFKNIMLVKGSEPQPFAPQRKTSARALTTLRANPYVSVKDELLVVDSRPKKLKRLEHVVLDGSQSWTFYRSDTGFKVLMTTGFSGTSNTSVATKFDGKVVERMSSSSLNNIVDGDQQIFTGSGTQIFVSVFNADSGWGDSYIPSADEIKAYFNGYKMNPLGEPRATPYNGTGTKCWIRIDRMGKEGTLTPNDDYFTTLPTASYAGWTPYQLQYELATPQIEDVYVEGHAVIERGDNYVTLSSEDVPAEAAEIVFADTMYSAVSDGLRALAKPQAQEVVLWEGSATLVGTALTLSESADNFDYLMVKTLDSDRNRTHLFRHKDAPDVTIGVAHMIDTELTAQIIKIIVKLVNNRTLLITSNYRWIWEGSLESPPIVTSNPITMTKIIGVRG